MPDEAKYVKKAMTLPEAIAYMRELRFEVNDSVDEGGVRSFGSASVRSFHGAVYEDMFLPVAICDAMSHELGLRLELKPVLTPAQYRESGLSKCVYCESEDTTGNLADAEYIDDEIIIRSSCDTCGMEWNESFKFQAFWKPYSPREDEA